MNLKAEIRDILIENFNITTEDYIPERVVEELVTICKKWALVCVGEDKQPTSDDPYDTNNGVRREIRQRIEESTK